MFAQPGLFWNGMTIKAMKGENMLHKKTSLLAMMLCVLLLSVLAVPALAETAETEKAAMPPENMPMPVFSMRVPAPARGAVRTTRQVKLTDEQTAALEKVRIDQEAAYLVYLGKLVDTGILDQSELDAYNRLQSNRKTVADIDMMQWTMEKVIAFRTALVTRGAELETALETYVAEGLLTQEEADALTARVSRNIDYTDWTVGQIRGLREVTSKSSEERVAVIQDLIGKGLLSQAQADVLLSQAIARAGWTRDLTEEQKAALQTAKEEYAQAVQEINQTLQDAGFLTGGVQGGDKTQKSKPFGGGDNWKKKK
jgi:Spy/CpxP family protein refolding chaperone